MGYNKHMAKDYGKSRPIKATASLHNGLPIDIAHQVQMQDLPLVILHLKE